jgi:long-chain fatty acid transport protein
MKNLRASIAVLIATAIGTPFFYPTLVHGDGVVRDSLGARTTGRGGVNLGYSDTGVSIFDNPAAMSNIDGFTLSDFGFDVLFTDLNYGDPENPITSASNSPFPMGHFAFIKRTEIPGVTVGLGFFSNAGFSSKYQLTPVAPFSGVETYKAVGALAKFLPAISVEINDRLSIGGNLGVAVNHMELEGPYFLQGPSAFAGTPTLFDLQTTGAAISWSAGLQYKLSPCTTIGVSYQEESNFELNGNTRVAIAGLGESTFDTLMRVVWPRNLGVGFRHQLGTRTNVGVDFSWRNWSSAFDSFDVTLSDPSSPVFAAVVGNELKEQFPLRWKDTFTTKLGVEHELDPSSTFRAGYVYHQNPIPNSTLTPFIQATLEHALSVGYGKKLGSNELDFAYQYSFGSDRNVGASQFIGGDFDNSFVSTKAHWASVGLIRRY